MWKRRVEKPHAPQSKRFQLNLKGRLALFPVTGAKLIRLKCVQNPKYLVDVPAHGEIRYRNKANYVIRVDNEGRSLADPLARIEDPEFFRQFAPDV